MKKNNKTRGQWIAKTIHLFSSKMMHSTIRENSVNCFLIFKGDKSKTSRPSSSGRDLSIYGDQPLPRRTKNVPLTHLKVSLGSKGLNTKTAYLFLKEIPAKLFATDLSHDQTSLAREREERTSIVKDLGFR